MDANRFGRISELFEATHSLSKRECDEYLSQTCTDDADGTELRKEVEELLAQHIRQSPLDTNAPGELAGLITGKLLKTKQIHQHKLTDIPSSNASAQSILKNTGSGTDLWNGE